MLKTQVVLPETSVTSSPIALAFVSPAGKRESSDISIFLSFSGRSVFKRYSKSFVKAFTPCSGVEAWADLPLHTITVFPFSKVQEISSSLGKLPSL